MDEWNFDITVGIIERCNGRWAAQCEEYDIAAQGNSLANVLENLEQAIEAQAVLDVTVDGRPPLVYLAGYFPLPSVIGRSMPGGRRYRCAGRAHIRFDATSRYLSGTVDWAGATAIADQPVAP